MKKNPILIAYVFLLFLISCTGNKKNITSIDLDKSWKFKTGDEATWSKPDADDSRWDSITTEKKWEDQGYANYDGYGWYRIKVIIPAALKESAYLKDSLKFFLGKIDDCDQFFLNGALIGENNKITSVATVDSIFSKQQGFYATDRNYVLSVNNPNILWDKENILAVRVFDHGGGGGMYSPHLHIQMMDIREKIIIDKTSNAFKLEGENISKLYIIKNTSSIELKGSFTITAKLDETQAVLFHLDDKLDLKPGESKEFPVSFKASPDASTINFVFAHNDSKITIETSEEAPYILTPKSGDEPKINGAKVVGVHPEKPFLFNIPASGIRPMTFEVKNLPKGLVLDANTGIITGKISQKGEYKATVVAKNSKGEASRELIIKVGDQIMLTPPMGWNSWNCWGLSVNQEKVIQSAHVFKEKGLMNHGWAFINIDDGWEAKRDGKGEIITNEKFPNMKALGDSLHKLGLKFGIYSSPGPLTCGGYTGSYQHEAQDARMYAKWGIDYLKYDWCSYDEIAKNNHSLLELKKPYKVMQKALSEIDRDIVFSLCQYGMGDVWEWGAEVSGNLWRTTGDIEDTWESLSQIGFSQVKNAASAGPGHWNDPDMLIVGWVGWGPNLHPTRLTVNEQYTHISLWSLLSAPLLIGCDLTRLDDFTLNLLTNDEVIAINQDPLGKQATPGYTKGKIQIWVKDLEDGGKAVGIFNLGETREKLTVMLSELGITGKQNIRDIWRQKNLGTFDSSFDTSVGPHGVTLVKVASK
jgi:hypothetical protein